MVLATLYAAAPPLDQAAVHHIPVAFSRDAGPASAGHSHAAVGLRRRLASMASPRLRTTLRQWIVPISLPGAAQALAGLARDFRPDLVHAMRVPYEGMLASLADLSGPLLISIWGNDFTLHAAKTPLTRRYTRLAMARAAALHTDCHRDARLAIDWGFSAEKPLVVLPSGGGIQLEVFHPSEHARETAPTVINPRGLRAYVQNEVFFKAVPLVSERIPGVKFICPGMAGAQEPLRWIDRYGGEAHIELLPNQSRPEMADLFRKAQVAVSITTHDGTPNTLLEAMACGCYPIAGDLESVREWITPGINGQLVSSDSPHELADQIIAALLNPDIRGRAEEHNIKLIRARAEHRWVMGQASEFYDGLLEAN